MYEDISRKGNIYKRFSLKSSFRYASDIINIATTYSFLVAVQINYGGVLNIRKSKFGIAFPQILGHSRTKNSTLATKTFYYICTGITVESKIFCLQFLFTQFTSSFSPHQQISALAT